MLDDYNGALEAYEEAGGLTAEKRVSEVLTGLGFKESDYEKSCSEFSGGWQMRELRETAVLMATTLTSRPTPRNWTGTTAALGA